MTILRSLQCLSAYPIPVDVMSDILLSCGLYSEDNFDADMLESKSYIIAKSKVYEYLFTAPNVSENGINFSFSDSQRDYFHSMAQMLRRKAGVEEASLANGVVFGYKGEDL